MLTRIALRQPGMAIQRDGDGLRGIAKKMNPSQVADAQRRVRAWVKPHIPCPPKGGTSPHTSTLATSAK